MKKPASPGVRIHCRSWLPRSHSWFTPPSAARAPGLAGPVRRSPRSEAHRPLLCPLFPRLVTRWSRYEKMVSVHFSLERTRGHRFDCPTERGSTWQFTFRSGIRTDTICFSIWNKNCRQFDADTKLLARRGHQEPLCCRNAVRDTATQAAHPSPGTRSLVRLLPGVHTPLTARTCPPRYNKKSRFYENLRIPSR